MEGEVVKLKSESPELRRLNDKRKLSTDDESYKKQNSFSR